MGNSRHRPPSCRSRSVHPHVHGELSVDSPFSSLWIGSSPRAWGTLPADRLAPCLYRFIPTCMGNSDKASLGQTRMPVHLHVNGELVASGAWNYSKFGSSHVMGNSITPTSHFRRSRFIPTCMGNSSEMPAARSPRSVIPTCMGNSVTHSPLPLQRQVHPHVHGELPYCTFSHHTIFGSSHVHGNSRTDGKRRTPVRFIPTCMGNSRY